jgi:hypothetical protein
MATTTYTNVTEQTAALIAAADAAHTEFPQYAGHWDRWVAIVADRDVKHRGRVVVPAGTAVLMDPSSVETITLETHPDAKRSAIGHVFATFHVDDLYGQNSSRGTNVSLDVAPFATGI